MNKDSIDDELFIFATLNQTLSPYLQQQDKNLPLPRLIVAFSGGKDSHVLLHALNTFIHEKKLPCAIHAFHVNHGLSPFAQNWANHCAVVCEGFNIPIDVFNIKIDKDSKHSTEALAREKRYQVFRKAVLQNDILLTAHTKDDQAETILLTMLRGAGLRGLSGIHPNHPFGKGLLLRPLLEVSSADILRYAKKYKLNWIEDESNQDKSYRRNLIRHEILPNIKQHYPACTQRLADCAKNAYESQRLLDTYLKDDLHNMINSQGQLSVAQFSVLSREKQKALLLFWIKNQGHLAPSESKLNDILQQILLAKPDKNPCIVWGYSQIRRYDGLVYLSKITKDKTSIDYEEEQFWDLKKPITLSNGHQYQAVLTKGMGIKPCVLTRSGLQVKRRSFGEKVLLPGQKNRIKLKHLLQQIKVPPWQRKHVPLFFHQNQLIAVGELWVSELYTVSDADEEGYVLACMQNSLVS